MNEVAKKAVESRTVKVTQVGEDVRIETNMRDVRQLAQVLLMGLNVLIQGPMLGSVAEEEKRVVVPQMVMRRRDG